MNRPTIQLLVIGVLVIALTILFPRWERAAAQTPPRFTRQFYKLDDYTGIDVIWSGSRGCAVVYTRISSAGIPAVAVLGTGLVC